MKHKKLGWISIMSALLLAACSPTGGHQEHLPEAQTKEQKHASHHEHGTHQSDQQQRKVAVQWETTIEKPQQKGEIRIRVKDDRGRLIPDFQIHHEQKLHLIVVSQDLSYFDHLHPQSKGNGEFVVQTQWPKGGGYRLYADFIPKGGSQVTAKHRINLSGDAQPEPLEVDKSLTKQVDGKEISLSLPPEQKAGQETTLTFTFKEAQSQKPITDLQPYLGAAGHVVIIREGGEDYLHVHPLDEKTTGPEAKFVTTFPQPGRYKIWGQFQHQGKVITTSFVVEVPK